MSNKDIFQALSSIKHVGSLALILHLNQYVQDLPSLIMERAWNQSWLDINLNFDVFLTFSNSWRRKEEINIELKFVSSSSHYQVWCFSHSVPYLDW